MPRRSLEELVTAVASALTATDASSWVDTAQDVLHELVDHFGVDACFLRRNDHAIRATILVAEWPPRPFVPDPDPLGIVYFEDADPDFARAEHLKEVGFIHPGADSEGYQERVREASGVPQASLAAVPLLSGDVTTGTVGLITFGDCNWSSAEVNVLKAIAALLSQVQERVRAEERLRYAADHDVLTGLVNRRFLLEHLEQRMDPSNPGPVAVLFLDLDRVKSLNDFLGHSAGDAFIVETSDRLRSHCGDSDIVARLGGDEFVVVFGDCLDLAAAHGEAARIAELVNDGVRLGQVAVSRSVSVGVASAWPGSCSGADLLWQADQAMLSAKTRGGNTIASFTEGMREDSEVRNLIELSLRPSIAADALHLVYQPEVDLRSGRILAVEALVRWEHPVLGLLMPASFIEVAESTNLASELGTWVFRSACRQFCEWRSEIPGFDVCLRVNVSPAQLVVLDFLERIADVLREYRIDGSSVCLEITENAVVSDLARTQVTLQGLADLGVGVAIDDFGTGYSALAQLKNLPVDVLKIDRGFVRDLGTSRGDLAIVKSIVSLADSFDLELVAEGVETELAARTLLELGCHRAQGYLFSRPVLPGAARELLRAGRIDSW